MSTKGYLKPYWQQAIKDIFAEAITQKKSSVNITSGELHKIYKHIITNKHPSCIGQMCELSCPQDSIIQGKFGPNFEICYVLPRPK